ncbi:MAG TPA: DUF3747 domain-containing protein [Oscillatoriales cyanobacterium M59_W2019_021]|nr:DUF3747 domain-containing protein [Oscillatoriales cyanobacterium M59_W2019_021]
MKSALHTSLQLKIAAFATAILSTFSPVVPASASTFDQVEVDQSKFIAIASPVGQTGNHQLLIVEQISNTRACWSESGSQPTIVAPLLLTFDFTGICGRSTDSNGYSIRVGGEDLGLQYSLRVLKRDGDMILTGVPFRSGTPLEIGRVYGTTSDFAKIVLNPGWRFAKRSYQGRTLGHVYLTNDLTLSELTGGGGSTGGGSTGGGSTGGGSTGGGTTTPAFSDIRGDIYAANIEEAVKIGFISGFPDNTFRPRVALTREQLVSMVLDSLKSLPNTNLNIPSSVTTRPYRDVDASRWSAAKILWAQQNNIVSGYPDGTFRPAQVVTRAEMMAVLRRASEYGLALQGLDPTLTEKQPPQTFSDTSNHWASGLVRQMSGYCGVASAVNETGTRFEPDSPALRNYAAAATLRAIKCVRPN